MSETLPHPGRRVRPPTRHELLRLVGTLAIFGLLGPPIGGLIVIAVFAGEIAQDAPEIGWVFLAMLIWGWWISYPVGILPALVSGVVVGMKRVWGGGAGFVFTLATGLVIGVVWAFGFMDAELSTDGPDLGPGIVVGSIVATLACWLITGGIGRAVRRAEDGRPSP